MPFDELDVDDVRRIFPELRPKPDERAIFQRDGAVILARDSIAIQVELAGAAGGALHANEKATAVTPLGDGVRVFTRRRRIDADVAWCVPDRGRCRCSCRSACDLPLQAGLAQVTLFRSRHPAGSCARA